MTQTTFKSLKLNPELHNNLASLGLVEMTPVQRQSLPAILAGTDVIAQAKTGSGKTAAFGLGILSAIDASSFQVQALVLCPTRELADQVAEEIRRLARATGNIKVLVLCGGKPVAPQATSLAKGVHVVVGTPGRIEDHLSRENLSLEKIRTLVLDEADRMLQMGFQESIDSILKAVPVNRQTLLLSATFPPEIESIAKRYMREPQMVVVDTNHDSSTIEQRFYEVQEGEDREQALRLLLLHHHPETALVFCNTRQRVRELFDSLVGHGMSVLGLHGELTQRERDLCMMKFSNRSAQVMVATDVAARGLDIEDLDVVVNFNVAHDPEVHVHRMGRTGRAGNTGVVWTFYTTGERKQYALLSESIGQNVAPEPLPSKRVLANAVCRPQMITLQIEAGKKQKLRAGDILGALTGQGGIAGGDVGKIKIEQTRAYVAVTRSSVKVALEKLKSGKIKGRSFRIKSV